jgi:hypothetical protein
MSSTLLLGTQTWDLLLDAAGNIAVAAEPYAFSQDAASACRTFLGEVWWDTTLGVDYLGAILGKNPPPALLKATLEEQAQSAVDPGCSVKVLLGTFRDRVLIGQVQTTPPSTSASSQTTAVNFTVTDPQVF